jgi:hypothetical protein
LNSSDYAGWNNGVGALPFSGILIGVLTLSLIIFFPLTRYKHIVERNGHVDPEERLLPMMISGIFGRDVWFAWSLILGILWVPEVIHIRCITWSRSSINILVGKYPM